MLFFHLLSIVIMIVGEEAFLLVIRLSLPGRSFKLSLEAASPVSGLLLREAVHHTVEHASDYSKRN